MNYNNLKNHIKSKTGQNRNYQAISLRGRQRKGSHPTLRSLMTNNRSGSGVYRRILVRGEKKVEITNPTSWRKKLEDDTIDSTRIEG